MITTIMYDFLPVLIFNFFFSCNLFIIGSHIVFISILGLLNRTLYPDIWADLLRHWILQCSALSNISTSFHKGRWFLFSFHIRSAIPNFSISPHTTSFQCSSSLLVGNLSHLCIFYHNCKGWIKHSSWSCWIPLVAWPGRDISGELKHLWILSWCHMDYISFGSFDIGQTYCGEFSGIVLYPPIKVSEYEHR